MQWLSGQNFGIWLQLLSHHTSKVLLQIPFPLQANRPEVVVNTGAYVVVRSDSVLTSVAVVDTMGENVVVTESSALSLLSTSSVVVMGRNVVVSWDISVLCMI